MAKAKTAAAGNIHFGSGVKTSRSFGPAPKKVGYRVHPTPHAAAPKSGTTGPIRSFPTAGQMQPSGPRTIKGSA
jgi:hypothetical protein